MATPFDHAKHSRIVAGWKAKPVHPITASVTKDKTLADNAATAHALKSPLPGFLVKVSFSEVPLHPDLMAVRSTNWRAEDEPSGLFKVEDCRDFYKRLLAAGFVPE